MRIIFLTLILCSPLLAHTTDAGVFPCTRIALKSDDNKNIILPGVDQPHTTVLYFFKNISSQSLWLDHPIEKRSASAGWSSYLQPGRWSVLLLNRKNFAISCSAILPGNVDTKDCAKTLSLCTPKNALFESKRKGSYWLTEDNTWDNTFKKLKKRGVNFK